MTSYIYLRKKASLFCKESEVQYDVMGIMIIILTIDRDFH